MPRLSLYRPNRTNDYRFFDRTISEMFTCGGLDVYVHKYMGPMTGDPGDADATLPVYTEQSPLFIEDLLLLENRDRKYDPDIYVMRFVYNAHDVDFDLTQFGLFLNGDTLFLTTHYNDMIDTFGRKLMSGDVLEFPNLKDYNPLNKAIEKPLPRYYVIQDAAFASEGFSQTWLPHLWRVKATPMVNAQEYKDILDKPFEPDNIWDPGNFYPGGEKVLDGGTYYRAKQNVPPGTPITDTDYWEPITDPITIGDVDSTRPNDLLINDVLLVQAEAEVPLSGYDVTKFYVVPTYDGTQPAPYEDTAQYSVTTNSILMALNGKIQSPGSVYTVSHDVISNTYAYNFTTVPVSSQTYNTYYVNLVSPANSGFQSIIADGGTTSWSLTYAATQDSVLILLNGVCLIPTVEYTVVNNILTLKKTPSLNAVIDIRYLNLNNPSVVTSQIMVANENTNEYTLSCINSDANLLVFVNGLIQSPINDYSVFADQLQFRLTQKSKSIIDVRFTYDASVNTAPILSQSLVTIPGLSSYAVNNVDNAVTPRADGYTVGYLTGDGYAPNGLPVTPGVNFPINPKVGDYALRLDYFPNRLFRFNGSRWVMIEENVRTGLNLAGNSSSQRSSFVNNSYTTPTGDLGNIPSRQSLSRALRPLADNGDQGGNFPPNPYPPTQPGQRSS